MIVFDISNVTLQTLFLFIFLPKIENQKIRMSSNFGVKRIVHSFIPLHYIYIHFYLRIYFG